MSTITSPLLTLLQKKHYRQVVLIPGLLAVPALALSFYIGIGWPEFIIFVVAFVLSMIGNELGAHRYFSHRSFKATPFLESALAILSCTAGQGSPLAWANTHRHHHEFSDDPENDLHTPRRRQSAWSAFWFSQATWLRGYAMPDPKRYVPDLLRNARVQEISKHYYRYLIVGLILPAVAGAIFGAVWWKGAIVGFLLGGLVRMVAVQHSMFLVNSVCHLWGSRPYLSSDGSRNSLLVVPLTLGQGWHNIHHAFPWAASLQVRWYYLDPGYWILWGLERVGLASELKLVSRDKERRRRRSLQSAVSAEQIGSPHAELG